MEQSDSSPVWYDLGPQPLNPSCLRFVLVRGDLFLFGLPEYRRIERGATKRLRATDRILNRRPPDEIELREEEYLYKLGQVALGNRSADLLDLFRENVKFVCRDTIVFLW